ncbi:MAG: autotransporter domain-containing protein [Bradyrhizobium sp.]
MRAVRRGVAAEAARAWLASTSLALLSSLTLVAAFTVPASAQTFGGDGGNSPPSSGSNPGAGGGYGVAGTDATFATGGSAEGAGGGGGGVGAAGGAGGSAAGIAGGAGGTAGAAGTGGNGGAGGGGGPGLFDPGNTNSGGGGGGGGGGTALTATVSQTVSSSIAGGAGGNGGNAGTDAGSAGGGGGAGGYGVQVTAGNATMTVSNGVTVSGGTGGNGGGRGAFSNGGNGGDGGIGINFVSGGTLNNNGTINGGAGGGGNTAGNNGAGVEGSGLSVVNGGTINGGITGSGLTILNGASISGFGGTGNAITLTGGTNSYTVTSLGDASGGGLSGAINLNSGTTLVLNQTAAAGAAASAINYSATNAFSGSGALQILTDSGNAVIIGGSNTNFTGSTTVEANSMLSLATSTSLGSGVHAGGISLLAGSSLFLNNIALPNAVSVTGDPNIEVTGTGNSMATYTGLSTATTNIFGADNSATADILKLTTANASYAGTTVVGGSGGLAVTLQGGAVNAFGSTSAMQVNFGSVLDLGGFNQAIGSLSGGGTVTNSAVSGTNTLGIGGGTSSQFDGVIQDGSNAKTALSLSNTGTVLTLSNINTYTGATTIGAGTTLALFVNGSIASSSAVNLATGGTFDISQTGGTSITTLGNTASGQTGTVSLGGRTLTITNGSGTFGGVIADGGIDNNSGGSLILSGGHETLTGNNTYSGSTTVNGGTLEVDGSIANSLHVTVNSGGMLTGTGVVDPLPATTTIMSGGTLTPGNGTAGTSMTIGGNLALQSGALYVVSLNPTTSSFTTVTGSATLGGAAVSALFANGSYVAKQYMILTAGSISGAFGSVANTNLPSGFHTTLSYDSTHAYLDLTLNFVPPPGQGLGGNQQGIANAIINFFNTNGSIPLVFGGLTSQGLTQISGETVTGSQQTTFNAMGQFMGVMTDPFMNRGGGFNSVPGASGYADEASAYATSKKTDAFAMFTKAPPASFEQRWSVWTSGFGGSQSTSGNAASGTNNSTSSIFGTAVGADYLFSPSTIAGFAMAGGGTSFNVANGGTGRSDLFQMGAYVRHNQGPAYISAALAYGWQDITTNRTVTVAGLDQLRAQFNANAWSGRLEGGYRFVSPPTWGIGITPYAAAQFVTFDLPTYAEQAIVGTNNFALAYGAHDPTDVRSEIGIRTDQSWALASGILTLRGRLAWAHDYDPDRSIGATFQSLPGASFVVNGAAQASDSALTTASIEMKWKNGWSAAATFEGEFSSVTNSYAGKGVVRYVW